MAFPDSDTIAVPALGSVRVGDAVTRRKVSYWVLGLVELWLVSLFLWEGAKGEEGVMGMQKGVIAAGNMVLFLVMRAWFLIAEPGRLEVGGAGGQVAVGKRKKKL